MNKVKEGPLREKIILLFQKSTFASSKIQFHKVINIAVPFLEQEIMKNINEY